MPKFCVSVPVTVEMVLEAADERDAIEKFVESYSCEYSDITFGECDTDWAVVVLEEDAA